MGPSGIDAKFNGEVFRRDYKIVIAMKRELAVIRPVRLAPRSSGDVYVAGQVLAKYTSGALSGLFVDYDNGGASGRADAVAVLLDDQQSIATSDAASGNLARALFSGFVFKDALIGYDASAKTDLGASEFSDAQGVDIVKIR